MDDIRAAEFRSRGRRIREEGRKLRARAERMPPGAMRDMLTGQAAILVSGADDLDRQALAVTPPVGTA